MSTLTMFDLMYAGQLRNIMDSPAVVNRRTGKAVKAVHGACMHLNAPVIPLLNLRDIRPFWTCAEVVWFMGGRRDAQFMSRFGFKIWERFADADGNVHSATGWRWRSAFRHDQLKGLVKKLTEDPTTRQAMLLSFDPVDDNVNPGPNVPCVVLWHFWLQDGRLNMSVFQRSADMYFGFPHDILGSRMVQELLAAGLSAEPGSIVYTVSNAHLYEDQWKAGREMIARAETRLREKNTEVKLQTLPDNFGFTSDDFSRAMVGDEGLPFDLHEKVRAVYRPWPAISGPRLVL